MKLDKVGGDPVIRSNVKVNGEDLVDQIQTNVLKDTWNKLCIEIDWKDRNVGEKFIFNIVI